MNFIRGRDPKETIGLGYKGILQSMEGCYCLTENDLYQNVNSQYHNLETVTLQNIKKRNDFIFSAFVIIIVIGDRFRMMKNRFSTDNQIYMIEELPEMVFKLKVLYDDWMKERKQL